MTFLYRLTRVTCHSFFKHCYGHTVAQLPAPGGAIIAANHVSWLDPPLLAGSFDEDLWFLAGEHLFTPLWRRFLTALHAAPVGGESLRSAAALLREGKKVVIFPEGTRSNDGVITPFHRGLGLLAAKAQCPVIPTYIHGTYAAWPRNRRLPRFGGITTSCLFGAPLQLSGNDKAAQAALVQQAHLAVCQLAASMACCNQERPLCACRS